MSSTYNSVSTSVDAQAHSSREDDLGRNNNHLSNTPFDSSLLSPYNHSHTISNSASPSNIANSTPGESLSEYSNYQPSEFSEVDDPFFGVDFDAGVHRIDSLPSGLLGVAYQAEGFDHTLPDLPPQAEEKQSSETLTASTYPLSPKLTSIPNTPSPRSEAHDTKNKTTISQHELTTELHNSRFQTFTPQVPTHHTTIQLTPDHSGSSHTSAEGVGPSEMARFETGHNDSQWGSQQAQQPAAFMQASGNYGDADTSSAFNGQYSTQPLHSGSEATAMRDDEGAWRSNEKTGQAGLDPERRKQIADMQVPNLKEQDLQRRLDEKNFQVESWRSQAGGSSDGGDGRDDSYFNFNNQSWTEGHRRPQPEEDTDIAPVDDAASIRENRLVEGQVYYNFDAAPTQSDMEILKNQPRHWSDAPSLPYMTETHFQPATANDAIRRYNVNAETMSLASRQATWGTRRRSEPSLADFEAVADGSFLKKLAISKPKDGNRHRQNSIFDQGLDRLANIVRSRGNSNSNSAALKRNRSHQNFSEQAADPSSSRHNSQGTLAPPAPNYNRRQTPSVTTAFAAMTGPLAAVGATHTHNRGGSVSGVPTSPKTSPTHLGFVGSVIKRARSRSDISTQEKTGSFGGLAGMWRGQGGPPVANLASPPMDAEVKKSHPQPQLQAQLQHETHDQDDDDEEDDDQADENDIKVESEQEPIVPNYEGFKSHVRRLNPDMDSRYNWLVSRIAHQQEIRYKNLLDLRVKHSQAIMSRNCGAGRHCITLGGSATLLDAKGNPRELERNSSGLQLVTDFSGALSDDSNPGEGALTDETFPAGVPMPPSRNLPAEFECQLCFKAKKFQKPSDWTKHVHEDVQPFTCTYDKCKEPKSFKRKADWVRHENERHRHLEWWICQVDDCRHPCYRKDNFLQHLVREHKLPEPKQKTKAAIKKARLTEPAWIMLEQCHHETQNKPQDEPCKFCGKTFNTWKKLTVHLAKHMEHISLPVLKLVEVRNVDANTIISPVEQILTPVTPIDARKMESASPFNMNSISPHMPMVPQFTSGYDQPAYYPTSGPAPQYGIHASMQHNVAYAQNPLYPSFDVQQMGQPRGFGSIDANSLNNINHGRGFGSIDSNFSHTKVEQSRGFGSMDSGFSNNVPDHPYHTHQPSGYTMPHNFATTAPPVSGYQAPNMLGISDDAYGFDPISVNGGQNFQQVPMSRAHESSSSYGHSPHNVAQNVPYYGHQ